MEISNSSLATETNVTQPNTAIPSTQEAQPSPASSQPAANATPQEISDWQKDERYERMWKKDPNGLYKSYRNIEKVYDPLKKESETLKGQIGQIDSVLKEYGYELSPEQLKSALNELKSYTTDDEKLQKPVVKIGKYFEPWVNDPVYVEKLDKFMKDLHWEKLQADYPGMTLPQIQKMTELEQKNKDIESRLSEKEKAEQLKADETNVTQGLDEINSYSTENGFAFTEDIKNKLLDYCIKQNIPTNLMFEAFLKLYGKDIHKSYAEKVKQEQIQSLEKNKNQVTIPANAQAAATGQKSGREGMIERLSKIVK